MSCVGNCFGKVQQLQHDFKPYKINSSLIYINILRQVKSTLAIVVLITISYLNKSKCSHRAYTYTFYFLVDSYTVTKPT